MSIIDKIRIGQTVYAGYYEDNNPLALEVVSNDGSFVELSNERFTNGKRLIFEAPPYRFNNYLIEVGDGHPMRLFLTEKDYQKFKSTQLACSIVADRVNQMKKNPDLAANNKKVLDSMLENSSLMNKT